MSKREPEGDLEGVRICVFAKPPVPGEVNTRLIPALGADGAARLAQAFLEDTVSLASSFEWARPLIATTGPLSTVIAIPEGIEQWPQGDGDLGERVERVLRRALDDAPGALALGVDSPGLPPALLERARDALRGADAVIGPVADGGFYTLGLTRAVNGVLEGITWSASTTCRDTVRQLRTFGYTVTILPEWFDVDVPEDLTRLERQIADGEVRAMQTAAALRALHRG